MTKYGKNIILTALTIWLFLFMLPLGLNQVALAKSDNLIFKPQVTIPNPNGESKFVINQDVTISKSTETICDYVLAIYKYVIGVIAIFAAVTLIIGGVIWITAAGSPGRIGVAKDWIVSSLTGLVLALGSFLLLATINPELVICRHIELGSIAGVEDDTNPGQAMNQACFWKSKGLNEQPKCDDNTILRDNTFCAGLPSEDSIDGLTKIYPSVGSKVDYCCCADNEKIAEKDWCKDKSDGQTCQINGAWGYCEKINSGPKKGQTVCRTCKKRSSFTKTKIYYNIETVPQRKAAKLDAQREANKVDNKYKCYRSSYEWECPDNKGICGEWGNIDKQDCNSSANGFTALAKCWGYNDASNGVIGDPFLLQCRCQ